MSCTQLITIKQGFAEDVIATVTDESWVAVDLTPYNWLQFIMVDESNVQVINDTGTFVDKPTGKIKYSMNTTQTANVWRFKAYFKLMISGVPKKSAPKDYFLIEISEDLLFTP